MNRRSFLVGLRNFAIALALAPKLETIAIEQAVPAETRVPPTAEESLTVDELNLITKNEIFPKLIQDYFFMDTPLLMYLRKSAI